MATLLFLSVRVSLLTWKYIECGDGEGISNVSSLCKLKSCLKIYSLSCCTLTPTWASELQKKNKNIIKSTWTQTKMLQLNSRKYVYIPISNMCCIWDDIHENSTQHAAERCLRIDSSFYRTIITIPFHFCCIMLVMLMLFCHVDLMKMQHNSRRTCECVRVGLWRW